MTETAKEVPMEEQGNEKGIVFTTHVEERLGESGLHMRIERWNDDPMPVAMTIDGMVGERVEHEDGSVTFNFRLPDEDES
jgi:hypothetical protein